MTMFYVFKSQTGEISIGTELRNRTCVYSAPMYDLAVNFAKVLRTSLGSLPACRNLSPSVNARGKGIACQQRASLDISGLIIQNTDHVPQRRVA